MLTLLVISYLKAKSIPAVNHMRAAEATRSDSYTAKHDESNIIREDTLTDDVTTPDPSNSAKIKNNPFTPKLDYGSNTIDFELIADNVTTPDTGLPKEFNAGEKLNDSSISEWASDVSKIPSELVTDISRMLNWMLVALILFAIVQLFLWLSKIATSCKKCASLCPKDSECCRETHTRERR